MAKYDDDDDDDIDIRKPRSGRGDGEVPNYLTQAVLVTLLCCLPFGIVAIVKASQVNTLLAAGKYDEAVKASEDAKKWCWISFVLGLIGAPIWIAAQVMSNHK